MGNNQFVVKKICKFDFIALKEICNILYLSGKDMSEKYDLHHWDNSRLKTWIIVILCVLKNDIYVVFDEKSIVATFQLKKQDKVLFFRKLATLPSEAGRGIGSFCMSTIEAIAKTEGCSLIKCEVYDKSEHAIEFYKKRNYKINGSVETIKYTEIRMEKEV